jgi:DNA repair protein RadD
MSALRPLREHQERAISELRRSLASGHKHPMVQMPTGGGKTLMSAHIIRGALDKRKRVAFCVPRLTRLGEFQQDELADAMDKASITGDIVDTWLKLGENRPTIAFCVNRKHAQHVCERFVEAGVRAEYADCDTRREDRGDMFARFRSGEAKVLCNVGILTTGLDLPMVSCVIDAQPTKSRILFVQKIGRGLRTAEGKANCKILDHAGNHLRLGMVTDIKQDCLDDGRRRQGSTKKERADSLPKLCPECKAVLSSSARECSACGAKIIAVSQVREVQGELVELGARRSGEKAPDIAEKAAFFGELLWIVRDRGYSSGWAAHKYREKFGVWPNDPRIRCATASRPSLKTKNWIVSRQIAFIKGRRTYG